jgi:hypothetical protein
VELETFLRRVRFGKEGEGFSEAAPNARATLTLTRITLFAEIILRWKIPRKHKLSYPGYGRIIIGQKARDTVCSTVRDFLPAAVPTVNNLAGRVSVYASPKNMGRKFTYNVTSIEVGTCITGHPYNGALQLTRSA